MTNNFPFRSTLTPSFVGYFFVPGPLRGLKSFSGDVLRHTDSVGSFQKNICISSKNRLFLEGVSPRFLVKNDQIFHFFMSLGISECCKTPLRIIFK